MKTQNGTECRIMFWNAQPKHVNIIIESIIMVFLVSIFIISFYCHQKVHHLSEISNKIHSMSSRTSFYDFWTHFFRFFDFFFAHDTQLIGVSSNSKRRAVEKKWNEYCHRNNDKRQFNWTLTDTSGWFSYKHQFIDRIKDLQLQIAYFVNCECNYWPNVDFRRYFMNIYLFILFIYFFYIFSMMC